jgi:hypothetical protein
MASLPPMQKAIRGGPLGTILERLVPTRNPDAAIYGLLTIGPLLTAETALHENYIDTVGTAVIALGLTWLAHGYATMVARTLDGSERLGAAALARALAHDLAIVGGAVVPVLVIVACWLAGADEADAVSAAVWSTLACLVLFGLLAGLRSSSTLGELVFGVGVGLVMGAGILVLRVILH